MISSIKALLDLHDFQEQYDAELRSQYAAMIRELSPASDPAARGETIVFSVIDQCESGALSHI
jgi:hypothetical protein